MTKSGSCVRAASRPTASLLPLSAMSASQRSSRFTGSAVGGKSTGTNVVRGGSANDGGLLPTTMTT